MNNATELSPCPFCGSTAQWHHNDGTATMESTAGAHWIDCRSCGASTNLRYSLLEDCRPLLAEQWNRRTSSQPTSEVLAAMRNAAPSFITEESALRLWSIAHGIAPAGGIGGE